ncbi:hypothetical protein [Ureaplasma ceti]|uniref:Uncharacterized protein n=1 Tax=Ureaplasma ceti TaxID=3119530 RepID=A0ABP9U6K6_9BACT
MTYYNCNEFALERLSKQISSKNKRVIAIQGLSEDKALQYMNEIKDLNQENIKTAEWTAPAPGTKRELAEDIKSTLIANTKEENLQFIKKKNWFNKLFTKLHTNYVKNKIREYQPYSKDENTRTKTLLWPLINTISSLGLALGLPLLSTLLYRQDAIVNGTVNDAGHRVGALGTSFYIGMLTFSILLIVLGAVSSVIGLIINLTQNRKEYKWSNVNDNLQKLIQKYFVLDDHGERYKNSSWWTKLMMKNKFVISDDYTFFYTDIDPNSDDYVSIIKSIKILNSLNNNVFFCLTNVKYIDDVRIFKNLFPLGKSKIVNLDAYKNGSNIRIMTNYIMSQVKLITGIEPHNLLRNHPYFVNALYKFIDKSNNNEEFMQALLTLKKFVGKSRQDVALDKVSENYFVDLFCLCMFSGIDYNCYINMFRDITIYGVLSEEVLENDNFKIFKLEEIMNRNFITYQGNSIYFKIKDFDLNLLTLRDLENKLKKQATLDNTLSVAELNTQPVHEIEVISTALKNRGFQIANNDISYFNMKYKSTLDNDVYLKLVTKQEAQAGLNYVKEFLQKCYADNIFGVVLDLYNTQLFFQLINDQYELTISI